MKKEDRDSREGIERWIDERIRLTLAVLTIPMESRIKKLRKRIERLRLKIHHLLVLSEHGREAQEKLRQGEKITPP